MHAGYYEELGRHPSPHRWAGWRGPLDHALRLELALAGVVFPAPEGARGPGGLRDPGAVEAPESAGRAASGAPVELLDLGCGTGELAAYLEDTGRAASYRGVDVSPAAIVRARERHPKAVFRVADLAAPGPSADLVVAVGAMVSGAPLVSESARWRALARVVAAAWRRARRRATVVVLDQDTLQAHPGWRADPALGGARRDELERLGRHLTRRWEVRRSPVGTDWALTLWRGDGHGDRSPGDDELVRRALASPWGRTADAGERAWLARARRSVARSVAGSEADPGSPGEG